MRIKCAHSPSKGEEALTWVECTVSPFLHNRWYDSHSNRISTLELNASSLSSLVLFLIIIYYAKQIQFKASICDAIICIQTSRVGKILELLVIYFFLFENIKTLVRRKNNNNRQQNEVWLLFIYENFKVKSIIFFRLTFSFIFCFTITLL
jgi:hypothetical protein